MSRFIIVIPVFDEARTIGRIVALAQSYAPVLVVDDGSTDRTAAEASLAGAMVLSLGRRGGKGAALHAGAAAAARAGAEWIVTLDGDGQHDPRDIPLICAVAEGMPTAIVVGGRLRHARRLARGRLNACRVASFFVDWITGAPILDTQSGFRCYPLALFDEIRARHGGFVLETALLVESARRGRPITEVDIREGQAPDRPSRFRPVVDGCSVAGYLASRVIGHGLREARAALLEVSRVLERNRRRSRHAEMAAMAAIYSGSPHLYSLAIGTEATRRAATRARAWWRHPRRRRAAIALTGIAAAPALLAAAIVQPVLNRLGADLVSPLVDRFFSQDRLDAPLRSPVLGVSDAPEALRLDRVHRRASGATRRLL